MIKMMVEFSKKKKKPEYLLSSQRLKSRYNNGIFYIFK